MKRLSTLIVLFTVTFAFFFIAPALLNKPFPPYYLIKIGDLIDLFTPLVLIPIYYLLLYYASKEVPTLGTTIIFLIFAALWVEGQGMHLSANSIGHWLNDQMGADINQVTYFYDEVLSHYLWHLGVLALSAQMIYRGWRYPFTEQSSRLIMESIAGILYGLMIFIIGIEGGTVSLVFPASVITFVISAILAWGKFREQPVVTFFLVGYGVAFLLFLGWFLYWGGFPQFSHLGWI